MGFSQEDLDNMQKRVADGAKKRNGSYVDKAIASDPAINNVAPKKPKTQKGNKAKSEMEWVIKAMFPNYQKEFKFAKEVGKQYRCDYYIPEIKTIVEYEGIVAFKDKDEKSRHTHINGYTDDCRKYSLASILGYRVLRYTTLNYKELGRDLDRIINMQRD